MFTRLLLSALLLCATTIASADDHKLEHVLVTTPIHKSNSETALPVTVLTGEQLREQASTTLGDTLANMPGLANASFGPSVGQPVIRGQAGPRVTVLNNGIKSADAASVSADHAVSAEPLLAETVEILRGPSTLLYGGGAIGGVINVIDNSIPEKAIEDTSGDLELRHGSVNDENSIVGKVEFGAGNWGFHVSGLSRKTNNLNIPGYAILEDDDEHHDDEEEGHDEEEGEEEHHEEEEENSNGFVDNTDSETTQFTLGSSYQFDKGFIGLAVSRLENEYGLPPGAHGHHEEEGHDDEEEEGHDDEEEGHDEDEEEGDIRLDIEQTRYDIRGAYQLAAKLLDTARFALTYTDYEHVEIEGNGEVGTLFANESWQGRVELTHQPTENLHGAIGLQFENSTFSAIGEEGFIPETDTTRLGLFIVEDYHTGPFTIELGARVDFDELELTDNSLNAGNTNPDYTSLSFSASTLWAIDDAWQLGVALSRSQRAPVTEELFSNFGNDAGDYVTHAATGGIELGGALTNSNALSLGSRGFMRKETSNNIDVSLGYQSEKIDGFITVYSNRFDNFIYLRNTGQEQDETPVFVYTQEDAKFHGVEFEINAQLASLAGGDLSLKLFGDSTTGELDNGADIPRLPPRRIGTRLDYNQDSWNAFVSVLNAADQDKPGLEEEPTEGYTRWDAGISYSITVDNGRRHLAYLKLKNISDEEIRSSASFLRRFAPEAGRSIEAGVRVSF